MHREASHPMKLYRFERRLRTSAQAVASSFAGDFLVSPMVHACLAMGGQLADSYDAPGSQRREG